MQGKKMPKKAKIRRGASWGVRRVSGLSKGLIAMGIMVFLVASVAGAEEIYKWTDENGTVHYSNMPPPTKKADDVDTVKEKTGVSKFDAPSQQQAPHTPTQPTAPAQPQEQGDFWMDEYGNRHPITKELIAQERARLEQKLRYYQHDCMDNYEGPFRREHEKTCDQGEETTRQKLKDLEESPQQYFYSKHDREKQRVQRNEAQKKDSVFNPKTGEHYPRSGDGYINPKTGEYYPASGNGAINPKTGEHYE